MALLGKLCCIFVVFGFMDLLSWAHGHKEENAYVLKARTSNERNSGKRVHNVMHLCLKQMPGRNRLFTCKKHHTSDFACVGAWEGEVKPCNKFQKKQLAAPICLQKETSHLMICDYVNISSRHLCFPRKPLASISDQLSYSVKPNSMSGAGFQNSPPAVRPCFDEERRVCLLNGALIQCNLDRARFRSVHTVKSRSKDNVSKEEHHHGPRGHHDQPKTPKGFTKRGRTDDRIAPKEFTSSDQTDDEVGQNKFFYVVKCHDCKIDHVIKVDEEREIEVVTFPK